MQVLYACVTVITSYTYHKVHTRIRGCKRVTYTIPGASFLLWTCLTRSMQVILLSMYYSLYHNITHMVTHGKVYTQVPTYMSYMCVHAFGTRIVSNRKNVHLSRKVKHSW